MNGRCNAFALRTFVAVATLLAHSAFSQPQSAGAQPEEQDDTDSDVPERVAVNAVASDAEIEARLAQILQATDWFTAPTVTVEEGVVFLRGETESEARQAWAGRLAANTEDVVAVVNEIAVREPAWWDLSPALQTLEDLGSASLRRAPTLGIGLLLLLATLLVARWSIHGASSVLRKRLQNQLLRDVAARLVAIPVFMVGLYVALSVAGLTGLAVTVVGGTGLLGLVIGFAFRDIAENFLASVLISMQRPFATNDLIEVAGFQGFVQSVNPRSTLLMTLDGNHVQIPNATIYKETITNFTANPIARYQFTVGIGYEDSIAAAQTVALGVLSEHPAVLDDPEPLVLVEGLGAATVTLRIYYWINITKYSHAKVRSAIIRLTKRAFNRAGISMPDEAREVVFPRAVPIRMLTADDAEQPKTPPRSHEGPVARGSSAESEDAASTAEGDLLSEAADIRRQANDSRSPEGGTNLLES
jgi:small-conductance mechanosensitive channel